MRMLLHAFDHKVNFLQALMQVEHEGNVHVSIGHENELSDLEEVSMVTKNCYMSRPPRAAEESPSLKHWRTGAEAWRISIGGVAVVGPTRMKYPKVVSVVDYAADSVSERVNRF